MAIPDVTMLSLTAFTLGVVVWAGYRYRHEWLIPVGVGLAWWLVYYVVLIYDTEAQVRESAAIRASMFRPAQVTVMIGLVFHLLRDQLRDLFRRRS